MFDLANGAFLQLRPRCLLFGGRSTIIDICFVKNWVGERDRVATLSARGYAAHEERKGR